jgi:formate hydrogenlyase subunit 3/multisubunit Na+/H+ antiporter MnhD subunit
MFAILWSFGNLDYATVFSLAPYINENVVTFVGICLLIGAMAKSSQVGLHVWLPMAMEGLGLFAPLLVLFFALIIDINYLTSFAEHDGN